MRWRKLGHVFVPSGEHEWMLTHAANPVADYLGADTYRIYFSCRDKSNRSSVGWVELDLRFPREVQRVSAAPSLSPGLVGTFDDSGCSVGCIVRNGPKRLMYYMGWNLSVTVPWRNSIGLAISEDGGITYRRSGLAPILDRSDSDPYSLSYPWVLRDAEGWRMWYGSHSHWGAKIDDMIHVIKHAESDDGVSWNRDALPVIAPRTGSEYAFARPCVLNDGIYRMWYAFRGDAYRIGYSSSYDGNSWIRQDNMVGIGPTPGEWDGEALAYPCVFDHGNERYMLYCGNGYGRSGFGLAVLDKA